MLKKSKSTPTTDISGESAEPEFRNNPKIDAKIDDYIKNNPKHWEYLQAMPRERMERAMVLHEVQKTERKQQMEQGYSAS